MIQTLAIANYRSLRDLVVGLAPLNVVTGANGSGKSSLYRALRLLADTAAGDIVGSLAREGGLQSTFWAGPESPRPDRPVQGTVRKDRLHLRLGFAADDFGYAVDLGYPTEATPFIEENRDRIDPERAFTLDPEIKRETIWSGPKLRPSAMLVDRRGPTLRAVNDDGNWEVIPGGLSSFESMMASFADPRGVPEMIQLREKIRSWRFYDHFRTDADAPCRQRQVGTHTPVLSGDGSDLAAALQTIREIGDAEALETTIDDAFPGTRLELRVRDSWFEATLCQHGLLRPLRANEWSDGTLRYVLLAAALLTPRPPELMVLNEPETSLHPELVAPLGRLIAAAARESQMIVVSHSAELVAALEDADAKMIRLEKERGETRLADTRRIDLPPWDWPSR
jgi:predicted ATPase